MVLPVCVLMCFFKSPLIQNPATNRIMRNYLSLICGQNCLPYPQTNDAVHEKTNNFGSDQV